MEMQAIMALHEAQEFVEMAADFLKPRGGVSLRDMWEQRYKLKYALTDNFNATEAEVQNAIRAIEKACGLI